MATDSQSKPVEYRSNCPVSRSLDLLGDKWTLLIMRDALFFERKTFADFTSSSEHIPTNLLSARLKKLDGPGQSRHRQQPDMRHAHLRLDGQSRQRHGAWLHAPLLQSSTKYLLSE